jgi:uncharacterized membrane protein
MTSKGLARLLAGSLFVLYPLLVYVSLDTLGPRTLAGLLLLAALTRLALGERSALPQSDRWLAGAAILATSAALFSGSLLGLKFYPVLVNAALLVVFGSSLLRPPTVIERIALLHEAELDAAGIAYTRKVTWIWCGFFLLNGCIASATVFMSDAAWALYNGLIAYLLIGLLFSVEFVVRQWLRKRHHA